MVDLLGEDLGNERYRERLRDAENERLARSVSASKPRTGGRPFPDRAALEPIPLATVVRRVRKLVVSG